MKNKNLRVFLPYGEVIIKCSTIKLAWRSVLRCYGDKNELVAEFPRHIGYAWAEEE